MSRWLRGYPRSRSQLSWFHTPPILVVANIPYYITSALIRHLLESSLPPCRLVLTVQREVARRICATPGDMSLLALGVQVYGHPKILTHIPPGAFYLRPGLILHNSHRSVSITADPICTAGCVFLADKGWLQSKT